MRDGDSVGALKLFDEAIRLNPEDALAYYFRGIAYGRLGQFERAIQDFDSAIRLNPQDAVNYYSRGFAHELLGNSIEAERDYATAKELGYEAPLRAGGQGFGSHRLHHRHVGRSEQTVKLRPSMAARCS